MQASMEGGRGRNASPLRTKSPRRDSPRGRYGQPSYVAEKPATNAGMSFGTFDRIEQ